MARQIKPNRRLSAVFHVGLLFSLTAYSIIGMAVVFPTTELTLCVAGPYEAFPINVLSLEALLDQNAFVTVFSWVNSFIESIRHDVGIITVPGSTIALVLALLLLLLLARSRSLIEKFYTYMAFPVF